MRFQEKKSTTARLSLRLLLASIFALAMVAGQAQGPMLVANHRDKAMTRKTEIPMVPFTQCCRTRTEKGESLPKLVNHTGDYKLGGNGK